MGVPKFFRWLSERYPAISQLIAENRIPEFDNLYLDMNGIIHNCTHSDSDSPAFRMTEDKMFLAIFNYIEHLFSKIKPKQLFFMAVDGVAPRAKMNQQRARRFRAALEAEKAREKAIKEGVEMPKEDPFDSNCITPGTEFMAKLTEQLKYFINKKVSEDTDWQGVEVVLSGHEVPGEGEHKIMEYIRQAKAQPNYDPNMRHCLYGLDADLIMLGLLSHDPHFCLLREEVKFGRQSKEKRKELEHQNFYLMHLCMVREYLELEFQELKEPGALSFAFDMERVIDDFILMAFFVGNDFLPNLPHLHINEGALALMFGVYKTVLPKAKGYINEGGVINLQRLEVLLDELSHVEFRFFESENSDAAWLKGKQFAKEDVMERAKRRGKVIMSTPQKDIYRMIKRYVTNLPASSRPPPLDLSPALPARDRKFVQDLADDLHLQWKAVENDHGERYLQLSFPSRPGSDEDDEDEDGDEEAQAAILRVIKRYDNAKIEDETADEAQAAMEKKYEEKFKKWKDKHYTSKFGWGLDNEEEMKKLTENYVQGLQWVLYYYYQGIASWPWFFGYHYAPMISDVKKGLKADMQFTLGQPFLPFQQLMGVLPDRSKKIVPTAYWDLMTSKDSPIIDFYPRDFELDMNGKKADWEAVVKIPFIDETRLLAAMATKEHLLTPEERGRNKFGITLSFSFDAQVEYTYPSSIPGIFPDLQRCHCVENEFELPTMEGLKYRTGLMDGVLLGASALAGFPSLKVLPFHAQLGFHGVSVFQQESRNESMVVTLAGSELRTKVAVAQAKLGRAVHVGYPFLQEAKVVKVTDELFEYSLPEGSTQIVAVPHDAKGISEFKRRADRIEDVYSKRLGMEIGTVESLLHVEMLKGLKRTDHGATVKEYSEISGVETEYATQTTVDEVISVDQRFIEKPAIPIEEEFPIDSKHFFLGEFQYGRPLSITAHHGDKLDAYVLAIQREPDFGREIAMNAERHSQWTPSYAVAKRLQLNPLVLSKLTSAFSVNSSGLRLNLGLNLKFEAKKLKVLGYSRKGPSGWEYSPKAVDLIQQYMIKFPEFIAGISMKPKGDVYDDTDFYPKDVAKQKVKEITAWLKENNARDFDRVPLDADQMDSDTVKLIEQAADHLIQSGPQPEPKKISNIPRNAILKPQDADQRINHQKFALGDRIVYVLNKGKVPIGQRGTVIGITRTYRTDFLDVVFDVPIMSGSSLGERCSAFRGATVPADSVLNLTNRQVTATSKASAEKRHTPSPQPLTIQNRAGTGVNLGPGAQGFHPAPAPTPLKGSFKGAVTGQANEVAQNLPMRTRGGQPNGHGQNGTGRGRGRGGPHANSQSPLRQQPAHQNTPPPQRGNGRGRGRGGENINGPRGRGGNRGDFPNRQGFTVVDMGDPAEGVVANNPNFRPQNYQHVPPPASLDAGNTRGRGRGRGRGSQGRGRGRGTVQQQS